MHQRRGVKLLSSVVLFSMLAACAGDSGPADDEEPGGDLPLGDVDGGGKADNGSWGAALTCKPVPNLPPLVAPKITLSINGLTLHLTDAATGYDKVFPVGPGKIETDATSGEFGESLSYWPIAHYGTNDFAITPATEQPCKTWWTDPETGDKSPVFAGLPFLSWSGNFAIHGPIDNYTAANGGNLRRGFVSHGCFRMEAADILEVYARIKGVARIPVHVQREPERTTERVKVDLAQKWVGAECSADTDCNYTGGFCAKNALAGGRGFCSAHCTAGCADRAGYPTTFCVADPAQVAIGGAKGMCVPKALDQDYQCRPYNQMKPAILARFNQPTVKASVCSPASGGWVGDHCAANSDCASGTTCAGASAGHPGTCTMACTQYCMDQPGYPDTFCAAAPSVAAGGSCLRQCTPSANAPECPADQACTQVSRFGQASVAKYVCMPR